MTEREKMDAGMLYDPGDADILKEQRSYQDAHDERMEWEEING